MLSTPIIPGTFSGCFSELATTSVQCGGRFLSLGFFVKFDCRILLMFIPEGGFWIYALAALCV